MELTNKDKINKLNLDDQYKWFLSTNFNFMPYIHIETSSIEILREKNKSFRIIGIPKNILGTSSVEKKSIANPVLEFDKHKNESTYEKTEENYKKTKVRNKKTEDKYKQKKYLYKSTDDIKQEAYVVLGLLKQLDIPIKVDLIKELFRKC